jgi:hypothetical protein
MAGPSIVVKVLADTKGLAGSFNDTAKQAESASSRIRGSFQGMLGVLNRTGVLAGFGEAIAAADEALTQLGEHGKRVGQKLIGAGGIAAGAGVGLSAIGSKDQAAQQQLQAAIEATGKSYDDYESQIEQAVKSQEKFGQTANSTQDALRVLTQATGSPEKALQLLNTAADLAAAKHIGLSEAATKLGKVYNGNTKLLKEFGITVTKSGDATKAVAKASAASESADRKLAAAKQHLADIEAIDAGKKHLTVAEAIRLRNAQQAVRDATANAVDAHKKLSDAQDAATKSGQGQASAVDQLSAKLSGQASAAADTFTGHLKAITAHVEDQAAAFGQKYGPAITAAGAAMTVFGGVVDGVGGIFGKFKTAQEGAAAAQTATTVAAEGATVALDEEAAAATAADAASLPLIATVGLIVLGIAALIAIGYVIYRNWNTIWAAMKTATKAVWDWIKNNWPYLLGIILGPIGIAAALIYKHWDTIKNGAKAAVDWIKGVWNGLVDFFVKLPGRMARLGIDIFKGLVNGFIWAINQIIDVWNGLQFTIPGISVFGHHIGGITIGVPDIPHIPTLAAGGLITGDGLIFAHAGEVISPIDKVPRGPAVVVNEAHFADTLDIDLFMRRAAWAVQTGSI